MRRLIISAAWQISRLPIIGGIDKQYPEFDDDKGVTLVLVNSEAGAELLAQG